MRVRRTRRSSRAASSMVTSASRVRWPRPPGPSPTATISAIRSERYHPPLRALASDAPPDASVEAPADASLRRTPLHPVHVELGARLVPFGGWDMPVQYGTGVLAEHHAVRERAGLFDIGHMGQFGVDGLDALEFIQWVSTHDASRLEVGAAQY